MNEQKITKDIFTDASLAFSRVNVGDTVDGLCGYRECALSIGDIVHLLRGGCLYTNDGEYGTTIVLKRLSRDDDEYEDLDADDDWDYSDICYECGGYGDDYSFDEDGEIVSACPACPFNRFKEEIND